jgi:hypothetical protein
LGLEDSLDNLLFFNQESTDNAVSDAKTTTGTTIGTGDVLLGLGDGSELARTESLDLFLRGLFKNVFKKSYANAKDAPFPPFFFL